MLFYYGGPNVTSKYSLPFILKKNIFLEQKTVANCFPTVSCREAVRDSFLFKKNIFFKINGKLVFYIANSLTKSFHQLYFCVNETANIFYSCYFCYLQSVEVSSKATKPQSN